MKRRAVIAVLLVLVVGVIRYDASTAQATQVHYAHFDTPTSGQVMAPGAFYVAGWAFECATGLYPYTMNVSLFNVDTQSWWIPSTITLYTGIHRPDVRAVYSGTCPNVTDYSGYHAYTNWPPAGNYTLWVVWTDGVNSVNQSKPITIQ